MSKGTVRGRRPQGCLRLLFRAPIWLYRARLGWVLGKRFIMIEHRGRSSGKPRYVVVEVVRHDREAGAYVAASGWGRRADWYRNIRVTPEVRLHVGGRRFAARAIPLPVAEATRELCTYARANPAAFAVLSRLMLGDAGAACDAVAVEAPVVVFKRVRSDQQ